MRVEKIVTKMLLVGLMGIATEAGAMELPDADTPQARLYAERCSVCHALPHPARLDWPRWQRMLRAMHERVREKGMEMPATEWRQIAGYLREHARK